MLYFAMPLANGSAALDDSVGAMRVAIAGCDHALDCVRKNGIQTLQRQ